MHALEKAFANVVASAPGAMPRKAIVATYENRQGIYWRVFTEEQLASGWRTAIAKEGWKSKLRRIGEEYFALVEDEFFEVQDCDVDGPGARRVSGRAGRGQSAAILT